MRTHRLAHTRLLLCGYYRYLVDTVNTTCVGGAPTTPRPTASPTLAGSGYCSIVQDDLNDLISPHQSTTIGGAATYNPSCGGGSGEKIFFIDLLPGESLNIRQVNNFDSVRELRHGGSCPGANLVSCRDDPNTAPEAFTNEASTTERVFFIVDSAARGQPGAFEIEWSVTQADGEPTVAPTAARRDVLPECTGIFSELTVPLDTLIQNDYDLDGSVLTLVSIIGEGYLHYGQLRSGSEIDTSVAFSYIPTTGYRPGQPYYVAEDRLRYVIADEEPDADRSEAEIIIKVRSPLTLCVAGSSFETIAPTLTSDRVCRTCSVCATSGGAGLFESGPCQGTTDRLCAVLRLCDRETEYESEAAPQTRGFLTGNRVCSALTLCETGHFEASPPTDTTDRHCAPVHSCLSGHYEAAAPSATTDRLCAANPTANPTKVPTSGLPTANPTINPTTNPTANPTANPAAHPAAHPTAHPLPSLWHPCALWLTQSACRFVVCSADCSV